jgi:hypothetical protein
VLYNHFRQPAELFVESLCHQLFDIPFKPFQSQVQGAYLLHLIALIAGQCPFLANSFSSSSIFFRYFANFSADERMPLFADARWEASA